MRRWRYGPYWLGCLNIVLMKWIALIIIFSTLSSCSWEYFDHIQREFTPIVSQTWVSTTLTGEIYILPDKQVLTDLVTRIDSAQDRIWLEIYTWTEDSTLEAILRAKRRWVDIRIILEWSVYRTPWINNDTVKKLKNADIAFSYANNRTYTFTHIKMWMIDDLWCVSTGNWSYTSFTKNREFIYCSRDPSILRNLEEIFLADFSHMRPYLPLGLHPNIWLSPDNMREWIIWKLQNTEKEIILYNQTISDTSLLAYLKKRSDEWVEVELCQSYKVDESSTGIIQNTLTGLSSYTSSKPYLHAKIFLLDGERVIVWSANMTENAIENNREILLDLGKNKKIYDEIFSLYHKDCKSSSLK